MNSIGIGGEQYCFSKRIDLVKLGDKIFQIVEIDFGTLDGFDVNGLIGLNLLKTGGIIHK